MFVRYVSFFRFSFFFVIFFYSVSYGKVVHSEKFIISKTKFYKNIAVIKLYDKPVLNMYWVKLDKGGYKISGSALNVIDKLTFSNIYPQCKYFTDLSVEELKEILIKEYGYTYERIYVKSLNAIIKLNEEPHLYKPYRLNINPTTTDNLYEINRFLKKVVNERVNTDENLRKRFYKLRETYIKAGFSEEEADRRAKMEVASFINVNIKKWLPENKLPRKLYLVCERSYTDLKMNNILELHLYPVKLSVRSDKSIEILSIKNREKDIEVAISFHPEIAPLFKNKPFPLDLISINPIELRTKKNLPENLRNCPHVYIGATLYYGENPYMENYQMDLSSINDGFYLNIYTFDPLNSYKVYIKLDYYCAYSKRDKISLLNPTQKDSSSLSSLVQEFYLLKQFIKNANLKELNLDLMFVSPTGYKSDVFKIKIP